MEFVRILTILGSMGLFLYGMKLMSEALQKVAGRRIRNLMQSMTATSSKRILSGTVITTLVQSSSAVTVMVVSFVNAGLLSLRQAIGVILGANIGTTVTAWVIALFGFGMSIGYVSVPLAGLAFVLILFRNENYRSAGYLLMGFALLFLGLFVLQNTFSGLMENSVMEELLADYSDLGYLSILLFVLVGALLTAIIQSSSATIALTLVMCQSGWLPFEAGAAMILGENIGTTITANMAAIVANNTAKRTALSHTLINLFGAIWMTPLLPVFTYLITLFMVQVLGTSLLLESSGVAFALALFHTLFNLINVLIIANFIPQLANIAIRLLPQNTTGELESKQRLRVFESGMMSTCELSMMQAQREIGSHIKRTIKMFGFVRELSREVDNEKFQKLYSRIEKYDRITEDVQREIITYLSEISRGDMSRETIRRMQSLFRIITHVEMVADANLNIARIIKRKKEVNVWFTPELRNTLSALFDLLEQALYVMVANIEKPSVETLKKAQALESEIDCRYSMVIEDQSRGLEGKDYNYITAVIFSEIVSECEKLGDSIINISNEANRCD